MTPELPFDSCASPSFFAIWATDRVGTAELRQRLRPAHREWLRKPGTHCIKVRLGGPTLDANGLMNGTLLVVEAHSLESVEEFFKDDPYSRHDLFEDVQIRPWNWGLGLPAAEVGLQSIAEVSAND